jgi:5-methylcytosine-specific restriction endonuclease McrA
MIIKNCKKCGIQFKVDNYRKDTARFCSKICAYTDVDRAIKMSEKIKNNPILKSENNLFKLGHKHSIETRIKMMGKRPNAMPSNKKKDVFILCLECGKEKKIIPAQLSRAKFCSRKCANKNKDLGKTEEIKKIRTSKKYAEWRTSVFKRDNYTCQHCGIVGGLLRADHIKPFAYFPELRLSIDNGRTLCDGCHRKTETFGGRGRRNSVTSKWRCVGVA